MHSFTETVKILKVHNVVVVVLGFKGLTEPGPRFKVSFITTPWRHLIQFVNNTVNIL